MFENLKKNEISFECDYEDIKYNPNAIFEKYYDNIEKTCETIAYYKNFDKDILIQQSYIYFRYLCNKYDPYYNGNFIRFDAFLYTQLQQKLYSYVQKYYIKTNREQPTIFTIKNEENEEKGTDSNILLIDSYNLEEDVIFKQDYKLFLNELNKTEQQVWNLYLNKYTQKEIAEEINSFQGYVSNTLRNIKVKFATQFNVDLSVYKKQQTRNLTYNKRTKIDCKKHTK